ncbi:hypothetical protein M407DRAFT_246656, partial [Tulasnella calospora MUT 4182]
QNLQFDPHAWSKGEDDDTSAFQVGELAAPKVEFDPAKMLFDDLKRIYAETALFFFDPYGGTVIAGIYNPHVKEDRTFRALAGYSSIPIKSIDQKKPLVTLNMRAVLAEIERFGAGMIRKIVFAK